MAVLRVIKGSCPGQLVELHGERMVMGRHPNCHIVLDNGAVSRNHAQILESHGSYYLEDLRSRNGTLLNGQRIRGRTELRDNDEVKVCDVVFSFHMGAPPETEVPPPAGAKPAPLGVEARNAATVSSPNFVEKPQAPSSFAAQLFDGSTDSSSIISSLDLSSFKHPRISVRPEVKLQAVLEISSNLGRALELETILPKILESLFKIFPQADRCFAVLKNQETGKLEIKAMRTRREDQVHTARLSTTILNQAMREARALLSADAVDDDRFDFSESVANLQLRSLMCAPLVAHSGEALGVIQIDTLGVRQQFKEDDLEVLASVAAQAALVVENTYMHAAILKQRDLERELEFATQVQLGFLPTERPRLAGYQFYDFYEAAYRVGGDFFDYVSLPDGRIAVGLGDVAGKGISAALLMARLYSSARYELLTRPNVSSAMAGLNETLASSGLGHRFVTLVFAVIDPRTHVVTIVNAGHMAPLLRDVHGRVQKVGAEESGLPLGIKPDTEYKQTQITLAPGDMLLLYTDGVTEAMTAANEIYGLKRLTEFLNHAPLEVEPLGEALVEDVEKFCAGEPQRDDICLICFRRTPDE